MIVVERSNEDFATALCKVCVHFCITKKKKIQRVDDIKVN